MITTASPRFEPSGIGNLRFFVAILFAPNCESSDFATLGFFI